MTQTAVIRTMMKERTSLMHLTNHTISITITMEVRMMSRRALVPPKAAAVAAANHTAAAAVVAEMIAIVLPVLEASVARTTITTQVAAARATSQDEAAVEIANPAAKACPGVPGDEIQHQELALAAHARAASAVLVAIAVRQMAV